MPSILHPKYRPDIDGIRAIAVLAVVFFHAFPDAIPGGFIGVDIFFVISGYLISTIIFENLQHSSFSFINFYTRRIKRIFPALITVLIACHIAGWFLLSPGEYQQLGKHIAGGSSFSSNFILWNESGYFDNNAETKPLLHLWSLGIEEQFYIFWPLILWGIFKKHGNLLFAIVVIASISFIFNITNSYLSPINAFYGPQNRAWELLIGALLAYGNIYQHGLLQNVRRWNNIASSLGLLLLAFGMALIDKNSRFPGWWALLPCIGTALLILGGGAGAWINRKILAVPILVWIGLISFPLYLWHWPLLTFYRLQSTSEITVTEYLILILLSLLLATLTYYFIEKFFRHSQSKSKLILLILGMITIGYVGFNCYIREGIPFRKIAQEKFRYELETAYGPTNCFSQITQENSLICTKSLGSGTNKHPVFLWGDSHAAHLHAGLINRAAQFNFALYDGSLSACPPILNFSPRQENSGTTSVNQGCRNHNLDILKQIQDYKPKTVILAADWIQYDGINQFHLLKASKIEETIRTLKASGVNQIILIGNFPVFYIDQPRLFSSQFIPNSKIRTLKRINTQSITNDEVLFGSINKNEIAFISPSEILCNPDGCLMSARPETLIPMGVDVSHLSKQGSMYFINEMLKRTALMRD